MTALAAHARGGPGLLVIDQLDALSLASGRMPTTFDAVVELLREATAFPEMRVVLACREFDAIMIIASVRWQPPNTSAGRGDSALR